MGMSKTPGTEVRCPGPNSLWKRRSLAQVPEYSVQSLVCFQAVADVAGPDLKKRSLPRLR